MTGGIASMKFETLREWAEEEIGAVVKILPTDVQKSAAKCSVSFEAKPQPDGGDSNLKGDEMSSLEKPSGGDGLGDETPPRIRLFLANVWEWVEEDEQDFRDEVGTVYLDEIGHLLEIEEP